MSELVVEEFQPVVFKPVVFSVAEWHLGEAGELCRDWADNWPRWARKVFDQILLMASGKSNYLKAAFRNEVLGTVKRLLRAVDDGGGDRHVRLRRQHGRRGVGRLLRPRAEDEQHDELRDD